MTSAPHSAAADPDFLLGLLRGMMTIRFFEEKVADLATAHEFQCPVHLYVGQEAIAVGISAWLRHDDYAFSTHRCHGHYIAKGGNLDRLMAEICGKATGTSMGHGGSMHITDPEVGFMGSSAIVAGTIPIAVGAALSARARRKRQVSVAYFGDGATDEGVFYESVNLAALYKLPMVFVCENNLFSTHLPDFKRQSNVDVYKRVERFNLRTERADGNNVIEVQSAARRIIESVRDGDGPALLECMTFRWLAHVGPEPDVDVGFRRKVDIDHWKSRCPIKALKKEMIETGMADDSAYRRMEEEVRQKVDNALRFARESPFPAAGTVTAGLSLGARGDA